MIDLVMPVHNNFNFTVQAIKSIRDHTHIPYKIYLVDNNSSDKTYLLKNEPDIIYIKNENNLPFSIAVNIGLKMTTGKYIGVLNNDIKIYEDCFEKLIFHLTDKVKLIGPLQAHGENEKKSSTSLYNIANNDRYKHLKPYLNIISKDWDLEMINNYLDQIFPRQSQILIKVIPFFCVFFTRSTLEEIGYLDEDFINGGEDEDFCRNLEEKGYEFRVALDVAVRHYTHVTIDQLPIKWDFSKYTIWNMELLYRKHPNFYLRQGYKPKPNMVKPSIDELL